MAARFDCFVSLKHRRTGEWVTLLGCTKAFTFSYLRGRNSGTVYHLFLRVRTPPRPPGPPGYPLIGNVFDMPSVDECKTFAKWRDEYGDLVSLNCAGTNITITNSYATSTALLEKKSGIYCNRPEAPMATELVGWKNNLAFLQYGKRFREGRKLFHQEFGSPLGLGKFYRQQEEECVLFFSDDLHGRVTDMLDRHAGALIMRVAYGYEKQDHTLTALVNKVMKAAALATAPSHFGKTHTPWFPLATFHRIAAEWRKDMLEMVNRPFEFVKAGMREGTAPESFTSILLSQLERDTKKGEGEREEKEDTIKWLAGTMFSGGADTTYSTLLSFILAITLHPKVQQKAQQKLIVCDRKELRYCEMLVWEVFRWFSVVPIGIPHVSISDDIHEGYFIPKGSIVFQNLWLMSHDPKVYTNPDEFDPERYTPERGEQDPREYCFGFGRRSCPGRHLAEITVWIAVVRILSVFTIRPVKGQPVPEFECEIGVREGRRGLVWDE
ncbi:cytochrome P450 [Cyathus striatus]|nr:cytochrome P450 [Cyathus striatus]